MPLGEPIPLKEYHLAQYETGQNTKAVAIFRLHGAQGAQVVLEVKAMMMRKKRKAFLAKWRSAERRGRP